VATSHEMMLNKLPAIANVSSRRFGDSRKFNPTHADYNESEPEEFAQLNMALYRDRETLLAGHLKLLAAFNAFVDTCTPFTKKVASQ